MFVVKMMVGCLLEGIKAVDIIVPPRICMVINTSYPQSYGLARPGGHVYWIFFDFMHGSLPVAVHVYECVGTLFALYIV